MMLENKFRISRCRALSAAFAPTTRNASQHHRITLTEAETKGVMTKKTGQDPLHSSGKPPLPNENRRTVFGRGESADLVGNRNGLNDVWNSTALAAAIPNLAVCLKATLGVTIALHILNQKHLLPRPLSGVVSRALFWPTLPITVARRIGKWETVIDDTVIMGGAPFGFAKIPEKLYEQYGVRGVVNLCEEYRGPVRSYEQLGMRHLHLPTTDHFEPTLEDIQKAVLFIAEHEALGKRVYVHCRAGHGRSAAVVFAWLLTKNPDVDMEQLNREFCDLRRVRKTLWKQRNIVRFHTRFLKGDAAADDEDTRLSNEDEL